MHDQTTPIFEPESQIAPTVPQHFAVIEPQPVQTNVETPAKKRGNGMVVGISIGALIGGIIGGATGAIVTSNSSPSGIVSQQFSPTVLPSSEGATSVAAIAQAATQSVVTIEASANGSLGTGSGVIYSSDGYIITNAHVVTTEGTSLADTAVRVFLSDGRIYQAKIVGTAPYADIAVLKIEEQNLPAINIADSEKVLVGDLAVAIGAPFNLSNTVTSGVVSTVNRGIGVGSPLIPKDNQPGNEGANPWNFNFDIPGRQSSSGGQVTLPVVQTDADINPGNSGGALLNAKGELIGINVAIASTGSEEQRAGSVGLGFAIPSTLAVRVAESIISGEPVTHGLLGATVEDSRSSNVSTVRGGLVREVSPGGAAETAGIRAGDIIVSINDVATPDGTSVSAMVRYFESGTNVKVGFQRDGNLLYEEVTLGSLT